MYYSNAECRLSTDGAHIAATGRSSEVAASAEERSMSSQQGVRIDASEISRSSSQDSVAYYSKWVRR